jgi:hypothetical protein
MWVPPEIKDPVLLHEPTRKSVGYFGAVRLRDGKLLYAWEEEKFDAQSCWRFLKQLRQKSLRAASDSAESSAFPAPPAFQPLSPVYLLSVSR